MISSYFEEEITLSPSFKLWDRGDGIGEISLHNTIIGYIHGDNQLSDGYYYDEDLEQYVEDTEVEFIAVSCFPGHLSSGHTLFQPFSNTYIDCIEHLISLIQSLPSDLLPEKPKGSVIDIFSGQEKFLISRDFDVDLVRYGKELDKNIVENFNSFSCYMKNYLQQFPEVHILFLNHCYVNGNVYVQYQLNNNYFLSVLFNKHNEILLGKINKSGKFNNISTYNCEDNSYKTICDSIFLALNLSYDTSKIHIHLAECLSYKIPKQKNIFFNDIIAHHSEEFLLHLYNRGRFLLERDLNIQKTNIIEVHISRAQILILQEKLSTYDISISDGLSLFMNYFLSKHNNID